MSGGSRHRLLDPNDDREVAGVVAVHNSVLATSPLAQLGGRFMQRYYYRVPVRDRLVRCNIAVEDDDIVGFLAWTPVPGLGGALLRRHPISFTGAMAWALLTSPARLHVVWRLVQFSRLRQSLAPETEAQRPCGELLSLAVKPEFTSREFFRRTRRRISLELLNDALRELQSLGLTRFSGYVETANQPVLLLYNALGCDIKPIAGTPTAYVEGDIPTALEVLREQVVATR